MLLIGSHSLLLITDKSNILEPDVLLDEEMKEEPDPEEEDDEMVEAVGNEEDGDWIQENEDEEEMVEAVGNEEDDDWIQEKEDSQGQLDSMDQLDNENGTTCHYDDIFKVLFVTG